MQSYEYQVCSVQYGRVTFVNGRWRGSIPMGEDTNASLESCPNVWDYLQEAGRDMLRQRRDGGGDLKRPSW